MKVWLGYIHQKRLVYILARVSLWGKERAWWPSLGWQIYSGVDGEYATGGGSECHKGHKHGFLGGNMRASSPFWGMEMCNSWRTMGSLMLGGQRSMWDSHFAVESRWKFLYLCRSILFFHFTKAGFPSSLETGSDLIVCSLCFRIKIEEEYAKNLSKLSLSPLALQEEGWVQHPSLAG